MKKLLLATSLAILSMSAASVIAQIQPEDGKVIESEPEMIKPSTFAYPDNSNKKMSHFNDNFVKLQKQKVRDGLKTNSIKLVSYKRYLEERAASNPGGLIENYQIDPNRQVFLMEVHAPKGVEIPGIGRGVTKDKPEIGSDGQDIKKVPQTQRPQKLKKAKLFLVFDAETLNLLSSDIIEVQSL
jgi:hypothetical protein